MEIQNFLNSSNKALSFIWVPHPMCFFSDLTDSFYRELVSGNLGILSRVTFIYLYWRYSSLTWFNMLAIKYIAVYDWCKQELLFMILYLRIFDIAQRLLVKLRIVTKTFIQQRNCHTLVTNRLQFFILLPLPQFF